MEALNFTLQNGRYVAEYVSAGEHVVQIERSVEKSEVSALVVYMHLDGMTPVPVASWGSYDGPANVILTIHAPAGVNVRIESVSPVVAANRLEVES